MKKNLNYILGIDLGIASVGWSVVEAKYSEDDKRYFPKRLINCGVRTFPKGEVAKTGESLNKARREARGIRRNLRRRKERTKKLREILAQHNISDINEDFGTVSTDVDIWQIRGRDTFERVLADRELARVILHIAKKRGYKSNRKQDAQESSRDEKGKVLSAINENKKRFKENNVKTFGQLVYKLYGGSENLTTLKKNTTDSYKLSFDREGILDELKIVLLSQKDLGNKKVTDSFIIDIIEIVSFQRPFASGDQIKSMIGYCEFENDELRAPKASLSFIEFRFWQDVQNNLILIDTSKGKYAKKEFLTSEQKEKLYAEVFSSKKPKITYAFVREKLSIPNNKIFYNFRFNGIYRAGNKELEADDKVHPFFNLTDFQNLRKAVEKKDKGLWQELLNNRFVYNTLTEALSYYRTDEDIETYLKEKGLENKYVELAKDLPNFSKFGKLSIKALDRILPYIKEHNYTDSYQKAGYSIQKDTEKDKLLPVLDYDEIRNPVVFRALTQARKVVNAIVREYGSPSFIHIELAREMAKNTEERRKIERKMKERRDINEKIVEKLLKEVGIRKPKGGDILRFKLWEEQSNKCIYSGEAIPLEKLFEDQFCQIDHAIPYSRSMNDSYNNKVLVLTRENQEKRNETPYQYLNRMDPSGKRWNEYKAIVETNKNYDSFKEANLLIENDTPYDIEEFIERNLNDTKYISRFFKNYLEENLEFAELESSDKRRVYTFQGRVTAQLRRIYDISKDRLSNDRHHAIDATILAVGSQSLLISIIKYHKDKEEYGRDWNIYKEKNKVKFPEPWKNFKKDIANRIFGTTFKEISNIDNFEELYGDIKKDIKPLFVSRMPRRKVRGAAHDQTLLSPKYVKEGFVLKRVSLDKINKQNIENIYGDDVVKRVIRERLEQFDWDNKKAFEKPLYKPSTKSNNPNQIKSVKLKENTESGVFLNKGKAFAKNSSMVRIDVFKKEDKYYIVPIYVADTTRLELPNKAITAGRTEKDWTVIDNTFEFQFTLYPNDLISIESNNEVYNHVYYVKTHRGTGGITVKLHDASKEIKKGSKTALNITKYQVDVLGNIFKVKAEKRHGFSKYGNSKTC